MKVNCKIRNYFNSFKRPITFNRSISESKCRKEVTRVTLSLLQFEEKFKYQYTFGIIIISLK